MSSNFTRRDIIKSLLDNPQVNAIRSNNENLTNGDLLTMIDVILNSISNSLASGRNVELRNFGSFEIQVHKSRIGRNPKSPQKDLVIPERAVIKFRAGSGLKNKLATLDCKLLKK